MARDASLLALVFAWQYFPDTYSGSPFLYVILGTAGAVVFSLSLLAHELAHAVSAQLLGLRARRVGLFIWGGFSDAGGDQGTPLRQCLVALAGPAASFILASIFLLLWRITSNDSPLGALAGCVALASGILSFCNLIPAYPLDGGRILRSIVWWEIGNLRVAEDMAVWVGRGHAVLAVPAGIRLLLTGAPAEGIAVVTIGSSLAASTVRPHAPTS